MSNVVRLFAETSSETATLEPDAHIVDAVINVAILTEEMSDQFNQLSKHFDSIASVIEAIADTDTRDRLRKSTKLSQEMLLITIQKLSRKLETAMNVRSPHFCG